MGHTHGPGVAAPVCTQQQLWLVAGQHVATPGLGAARQRVDSLRGLQAPATGLPAQRRHLAVHLCMAATVPQGSHFGNRESKV